MINALCVASTLRGQVTLRNLSAEYASRYSASDRCVRIDACLQLTLVLDDGTKQARTAKETFRWVGIQC
jgi:hypothetical protein